MEINSRDIRGSTPLHHAAATGNELFITFAVALNADVDAKNRENKTPLIDCCSRFNEHWNSDCIKKLLLAGADKNLIDSSDMRAIDYLMDAREGSQFDSYQHNEAVNVLNEKRNLLHVLAIRNSYSKQKRSTLMIWLYYIIMTTCFFSLELAIFRVLRNH